MLQDLSLELNQVMPAALATGLFSSVCTIQAPSGNLVNGVPDGTYINVPTLVNLRCIDAPPSINRITSKEKDTVPVVIKESDRHILLEDFFPEFPGLNWGNVKWRAIVDGVTYAIVGAEVDSQNQMVRLALNLVTV